MYMKLIGRILWNELSVWMRNWSRENHFDLDRIKIRIRYQQIKNKLNKDYLFLFLNLK